MLVVLAGKLAIYTAAGGIDPTRCLPVTIDVGTNNQALLDDPYYMGLRHPRIEGAEYFELMDEFMNAIYMRYPNALVQFEDFKTPKAEQLLNRYRNNFTCFNDDMQGSTGAVALAGLLAALRKTGTPLTEAKIVCVGAGSAGIGVCSMLADAMVRSGLSAAEAYQRFWLIDEKGLITSSRTNLQNAQIEFARRGTEDAAMDGSSLKETVDAVKPNILLGLSGCGGVFTEDVVRTMATHCEQPIIFAMSNPTHLSECTAQQAYEWTDGRATFASGSPFDPVTVTDAHGKQRTLDCSQANNMYIFPGLGLGVVASRASRVTDRLFYVAAQRLADCVSDSDLAAGKVFPPISEIREVSRKIAVAVAIAAYEDGLARISGSGQDWYSRVGDIMWEPVYPQLVRASSIV
ncbi:malate dehydrogenase [Salpingoeca rosetta]|uniref:Malate dehydrogenase n=1 Tax=Salpingoeca rosetta (strain ATCC 50818 / BSB-021) TaxID=946362 RepID=F2UBW2_SALR5|nr:malate dehydrogenase [Salpingoeca rosetta]EGD73978.1 malate dehydrogenase [Salpingoeca rosetta]|eukprot:XP_004993541.1 malate dehydrogenase [Salpingoeca rosetta]